VLKPHGRESATLALVRRIYNEAAIPPCNDPVALTIARQAPAQNYAPNWESIDKRPTPQWFDDAKFGIFIHWGVYSVPAFADPHSKIGESYAEWYWNHMQNKNGPTWAFHLLHYGANFKYQDFAGQFKAELYDPDQWADLFASAGARYVILTFETS